jgi:putative chitinase
MMEIFPKYNITTIERVAGFVAQTAHESTNYRTLEENLNYSAKRLVEVFPRYFGPGKRSPAEYANNPEKLANYIYMDEFRSKSGAMGNTQPGDGWRFRGRGLKQLTGRDNYARFGKTVGMTAEKAAEYVATEKGAIESACWFWNQRNLNPIADTKNIRRLTEAINGGTIGLDDRTRRFNEALQILSQSTPAQPAQPVINTLRRGSTGNEVKKLQEALNITPDGSFGSGTEIALRLWQAKNGFSPTGIATPEVLRKLIK